MIRVLIAEDSRTVQRTLVALLENEPDIEIVGLACNGVEAIEMCHQHQPDLVTMDIFMPEMNGLEATKRIMAECPTRIVIISSMVGSKDVHFSFDAMRAGAVEIIEKPGGVLTGNYAAVRNSLVKIVKEMSVANLRVQQRKSTISSVPPYFVTPELADQVRRRSSSPAPAPSTIENIHPKDYSPEIVCIGGSTGAPAVLAEILSSLPKKFPLPILVAQHISQGFASGMANWLNDTVALDVRIAEETDLLSPGTVYIGPDDNHILLTKKNKITFIEPNNTHDYIPSVNHLFSSAASVYGEGAMGILLSGMGRDGAEGLFEIKKKGGLTLTQSKESCIIYGMPMVAANLGAVVSSMSPANIVKTLKSFF